VAQPCNASFLGSEHWEDHGSSLARAKYLGDLISINGWACACCARLHEETQIEGYQPRLAGA
jgi:hypothetical protein